MRESPNELKALCLPLAFLAATACAGMQAPSDDSAQAVEPAASSESQRDDAPATVEASVELPSYTVLDRVNLAAGGVYGEVLIPTMERSDENREAIFRAIASQERLTRAAFVSTEDAMRANNSAAFLRENQDALKGFLGSLENGEFTPGEVVFP
jgi:hypothetical protein